jgi:hypothetical protein
VAPWSLLYVAGGHQVFQALDYLTFSATSLLRNKPFSCPGHGALPAGGGKYAVDTNISRIQPTIP